MNEIIKMNLEIKQIEINDITLNKICRIGRIIPEFEYMSKCRISLNNDLKDYDCKLTFTNNLSMIMQLDLINKTMLDKDLEFNVGKIRRLANESFNKDKWKTCILKQFNNTEVQLRREINREDFIDCVVEGFMDEKVIHFTREWHRGISKSYFINEMAREFKLPVFNQFNTLKYDDADETYFNIDQLRGRRIKRILVDECDIETVNKIREMGIIPIGFACTYKNYELI